MDESTDQIEREIRAERHQLDRNLTALEVKARQLADWRTYYRHNPAVVLGLALGGGMVLGAWAAGGPPSREAGRHHARTSPRRSVAGQRLEETWQSISDALLGVASARVMSLIGSVVPGFEEELVRGGERGRPDRLSSLDTAREPPGVR